MRIKRFLPLLFALVTCTFAGCDNGGGSSLPPDDGVTSIELRATGLQNDVLSIKKGNTVTIAASVKPSSVRANLTYTVADTAIASMNGNKLTGVAEGTTTLTVSSARLSKSISVNVQDYVPLTGITFEKTSMEVETGVTKQLKYTLAPENCSTKTLNFTVSPANSGVTVNSTGRVEIADNLDAGTTFTITATGTKETTVSASMTLVIKQYQVEDVLLLDNSFTTEISTLEVPLDEPYRVLFAMVKPEKALPYEDVLPVTWTSSDPATVSVSNKGRLTFLKKGNATITMSSSIQGSTFTKTCAVTVKDPSGDFIENYHIPQSYLNQMVVNTAPSEYGWQTFLDFTNGGTASNDARKMVLENYKPQTGPSSWFAGGGYCIEMGGWDNIHSGLEDDDLPGGGMSNLIMWTKVKFDAEATKLRTYFEYRQSDGTFKYKLRHTLIDLATKEVKHLSDWQSNSFNTDTHLAGSVTYIESDIPTGWTNKDVIMMLEYDDIDYTTDHILNGVDSVNVKSFAVLNDTGEFVNDALWCIGDSNTTVDYTGNMWANIASDVDMQIFRDNISGRTIAPASSIGIVDHIDSKYYEQRFEPFSSPKVICIQAGGNDLFWAAQPGNPLKIGEPSSTDKTQTYGAIKYMLSYFTTRYPNAKIILANAKYRLNVESSYSNQDADTYNTNLASIVSNYSNVSLFDMCGALYNAANRNETTYNSYFIADHIHFNTTGQALMRQLWVTEINKVKQ